LLQAAINLLAGIEAIYWSAIVQAYEILCMAERVATSAQSFQKVAVPVREALGSK
jgi:hypothetical protein